MKVPTPAPPSPIILGRYWNTESGAIGAELPYAGERHVLLVGPNGSGKATRFLVPNLLSLEGRSIVVIDPKGELAAITADYRRRVLGDDVVILNPFNILGGGSNGFNPLRLLDPESPLFYDDAAAIGDALIKIEGNEPHFPESAQGLVVGLIMWVRKRYGPEAQLEKVRELLTEADEWQTLPDGRERLVKGLRATAAAMVEQGGFEIASLAGRFLAVNDELSSIRSTADTQTRWLLSRPMREDLGKHGVDFTQLKQRPTTVYIILPAEQINTHSVWMRLVITAALRAQYRPGGLPVLFLLDEFYVALGRLKIIETVWALVRGYNIQMVPVLQSLTQLRDLYRDYWETFAGMAGVVMGFGAADLFTAKWMSERSGQKGVVAQTFNEDTGGLFGPTRGSINHQQVKRPHLLPQDFLDFAPGYGRVWMANMANGIPTFAPNYWKIRALKGRARPNPYHGGGAA